MIGFGPWRMLGARADLLAGLLLGLALLPSEAIGALAPQYQRLAELRAILNDPKVTDRFDINHPIDRVEWVTPDLYRVTGGSCHLDIAIHDHSQSRGRGLRCWCRLHLPATSARQRKRIA
jgi:hypothetical protein